MSLGIHPNSECEWDAIPQVWNYFDKVNQKPKFGIWYKPAALLKLDGKQVDYHILEASPHKAIMQDAFQFFDTGMGESSFNWQNSLAGMEHEINSELQEVQG
jgi:hypothetical protein